MIQDPCNSELVQGAYGNEAGILARYKRTFNLTETQQHGYLLWAPSYVGYPAADFTSMNCFFYAAASPDSQPSNTNAAPLGSGVVGAAGAFAVGASQFVKSSVCQDFRTVSACIRMTYTGTTSGCKGRIAILENVPANLLLTQRPSVDSLISMSASTVRVPLDTIEIPFRPQEESSEFRDEKAELFISTSGTATTFSNFAKSQQPTMIGVAWSGIPSNEFSFDFIQNIEWRPQPFEGMVEPTSVQVSSEPLYRSALKLLDTNYPGWANYATRAASMMASSAVNYVLGGPPQARVSSAPNRLRIMM